MLTLLAEQPECLWDDALPVEVEELPEDLAALDALLADHELLWPIVQCWEQEFRESGRLVLTEGRPTIAMETFIRLMVLKQRYRWGYRTLVAEVSDSIHLRRFCRIALSERVPDESTVRELTRRIGAETVQELTRALGCQADPPGQARQAQRVWVRFAVSGGDREHPARRAGVDPACLDRGRQSGRGHAAARNGRRAPAAGDQRAGGRGRWRVQHRPDDHRARGPCAQERVHRRPPGTRLETHSTTTAALPDGCGGPNQPPQTPLRAGPISPEGRPRPTDLD
jgi:Transposase domain (DUF772)